MGKCIIHFFVCAVLSKQQCSDFSDSLKNGKKNTYREAILTFTPFSCLRYALVH